MPIALEILRKKCGDDTHPLECLWGQEKPRFQEVMEGKQVLAIEGNGWSWTKEQEKKLLDILEGKLKKKFEIVIRYSDCELW